MIPVYADQDARAMNVLQLAYIGDSVYGLMMRLAALEKGKTLQRMHGLAAGRVSASAQARALEAIYGKLDEEEKDLVRRGKNAHPKHPAPRNASCADYSASTGLEALIGYYFLTGRMDKVSTMIRWIIDSE